MRSSSVSAPRLRAWTKVLGALLGVAAVAACSTTPRQVTEVPPLPTSWTSPPVGATQAQLENWWRAFDDPVLTRLIEDGVSAAPSVRLAQLRLLEARASARSTIARYLPDLSLEASGQYTRVEEGPLLASGGFQTGGAFTLEQEQFIATYGPRVRWEIPLLGRIDAAVRGARSTQAFAEADLRGAQAAIAGDIAEAYVALRRAQNIAAALAQSVAAADQLADILEIGAGAGLTAPADAADARRQAESLRARQTDLLLAVQQERTRLALLRGRAPGTEPRDLDVALTTPEAVPAAPLFSVPAAPADLLRVRPDVAQAEARALTAAAAVGAARADQWPQINLSGALSIADNLVGGPLPEQTMRLIAQPLISLPLFDWGQRQAAVRQRDSQFEQALILYRETVNAAIAEADLALTGLSVAEERLQAARAAELAATAAARGARASYEAGITSLPDRLRADQLLIDAQIARIEAETARASVAVSVYRAFGGGPPEAFDRSRETAPPG